MKTLIIILLIIFSFSLKAQKLNSIGFDFPSAYIVGAPKHKLSGDKYNPYMENRSGLFGVYYERFLGDYPYSIKAGFYLNYQYNCVRSFHFPIDFNGNILGKRNESLAYLGYTGGFSYNKMIDILSSVWYVVQDGTSANVSLKKDNYIAPHIGLNAGLNYKRIGLAVAFFYHFLVPEFVDYEVKYNNLTITEHNTNMSYGVSLKFGILYRF